MSVLKRKNSYRIIGFMLIVIGMSMLPSLSTSIVCKEPKQTRAVQQQRVEGGLRHSLHNAFVIVDEAQSLERNVLLTVLSRVGQNSKVVLTHDVAQRDNLRVGRWDGVVSH